MNVVILQPSYIPWRGYFDQIRRADVFVFYDDIQYDRRGWRNRNQIKTAQGKQWLTIPVHGKGAHEGLPIKDVRIDQEKPWARNHLRALEHAYSRAPCYADHADWLAGLYGRQDELLADFTVATTVALAGRLGIDDTLFLRSSEMTGLRGQRTDRLIHILRELGGTHYITGPMARDYLELDKFERAGISVEFMVYDYPEYPQLHPPYDVHVSILDTLFMLGDGALDSIVG
jgi:hypothetical protein